MMGGCEGKLQIARIPYKQVHIFLPVEIKPFNDRVEFFDMYLHSLFSLVLSITCPFSIYSL